MSDGTNPLLEYPVVRKWLYRVLWVAGAVVGLTQAVLSATDTHSATINTVIAGALAAIAYLSVLSNYTADRNVAPSSGVLHTDSEADGMDDLEHGRHERGVYDNTGLLIALACIVVIAVGVVWLVRAF